MAKRKMTKSQHEKMLKIVQKYHPEVTKVVDALEPLEISVTQQDVKQARRKSPSACAMAKACRRKFDGAIIALSRAYMISDNVATRYIISENVARNIISFDKNHYFAAGEYTLFMPKNTTKLGNYRSGSKVRRTRARTPTGRILNREHVRSL